MKIEIFFKSATVNSELKSRNLWIYFFLFFDKCLLWIGEFFDINDLEVLQNKIEVEWGRFECSVFQTLIFGRTAQAFGYKEVFVELIGSGHLDTDHTLKANIFL